MAKVIFQTDWGWCGVVTSPRGVARVVLPGAEREAVCARIGGTDGDYDAIAEQAALEIQEYLAGKRRIFTVPLDFEGVPAFTRRVLAACAQVPWGSTVSYGQLAARVGQPGAARAVGQALAANPVPLLVPCHRVLRADGKPGGFGGGLRLKRRLLALEGGWPRTVTVD